MSQQPVPYLERRWRGKLSRREHPTRDAEFEIRENHDRVRSAETRGHGRVDEEAFEEIAWRQPVHLSRHAWVHTGGGEQVGDSLEEGRLLQRIGRGQQSCEQMQQRACPQQRRQQQQPQQRTQQCWQDVRQQPSATQQLQQSQQHDEDTEQQSQHQHEPQQLTPYLARRWRGKLLRREYVTHESGDGTRESQDRLCNDALEEIAWHQPAFLSERAQVEGTGQADGLVPEGKCLVRHYGDERRKQQQWTQQL